MWDRFRKIVRVQLLLVLAAVGLAVPLSNFTAIFLSRPAAQFMNFVRGGKFCSIRVDSKGIPSVFDNHRRETNYNPVTTALYGLAYYQKWEGQSSEPYVDYIEKIPEAGRETYFRNFINCADWLVENLKIRNREGIAFGVWEYQNEKPVYRLSPPWVSALAQGFGIQVLARAHKITGEEKYMETAKNAVNAFFVEVKDGGVTYKDNPDEWWYEEYAHPGAKKSRVLNGMQFALISLYEYYAGSGEGNKKAKILFEKGLNCLKSNIETYDTGWWTDYDALGQLANSDYHDIHIYNNERLYELSGEKLFLVLAKKWIAYKKSSYFMREFIKQKPNYHDLTILGFNMLLIFGLLQVICLGAKILKWKRQ